VFRWRDQDELPGVEVQDVARSLYIHPFMLSRWRKDARDGKLMTKKVEIDRETAAKLKELRKIRKAYERLKVEHDLLKRAIAFTSNRNATSSSSSTIIRKTTP
jgi:transposase